MLGKDSCGCLYLVSGDAVVCVSPCDQDRGDHEFRFDPGWRGNAQFDAGVPRELEPVTGAMARIVFEAWGDLIADGYAVRDVRAAMQGVEARLTRRREGRKRG